MEGEEICTHVARHTFDERATCRNITFDLCCRKYFPEKLPCFSFILNGNHRMPTSGQGSLSISSTTNKTEELGRRRCHTTFNKLIFPTQIDMMNARFTSRVEAGRQRRIKVRINSDLIWLLGHPSQSLAGHRPDQDIGT